MGYCGYGHPHLYSIDLLHTDCSARYLWSSFSDYMYLIFLAVKVFCYLYVQLYKYKQGYI